MSEVDKELGRHEAEIGQLQKDMTEVKADVKSILSKIDQAQGGWKTILAVGGVAGAIGAFLSKTAAAFVSVKPHP